ncbi:MAG: T9SS type A sorting domain-containing protein, partial [Calditrichaeota bacterium]|nr:T9SS type A sorting domain-containing protein [Calditrichota bacterium]
ASVKNTSNYTIEPAVAIQSIDLNRDSTQVTLHTEQHHINVRYTLKISHVKNHNGVAIASTYQTNYEFTDTTPPSVVSVDKASLTKLVIHFSEALNPYAASQVSNYSISPSVSILQVKLDSTNQVVTLITNPHHYETDYELTIANIEDAYHNKMQSPYHFSYRFEDKQPPFLTNFQLINRQTILMEFSEPVDRTSATDSRNYKIEPTVAIQSVELKNDQKTVVVHTAEHEFSTTYRLTFQNIQDINGNAMQIPYILIYTYSDVSPPSVVKVKAIDPYTLGVEFSEKMNYQSIKDKSHYSIQPYVEILSVDVDTSLKKVVLNTRKHLLGQTYTLTVREVKDLNQNTIAAPFEYEYNFSDKLPPYVVQVNLLDRQRVQLIFSEPMDPDAIGDVANYAVSPDIRIYRVDVDSTHTQVVLYTATHELGVAYSLSFEGIHDLAGNSLPPNYSISYRFAQPVQVTGLNRGNYQLTPVQTGEAYYVDRDYKIQSIPRELQSAVWLKTANNDKFSTGSDFLEFTINQQADLFVGYDTRLKTLPNWLASWDTTQYRIVDEHADTFQVYHMVHDSGRVVLGGNYGTDQSNMYLVLLKGRSDGTVRYPDPPQKPGDTTPKTHIPETIVLNQNYPNPFNPTTIISFSLAKEDTVQIDIFNLSGQMVQSFRLGALPAGTTRIVWDATNAAGEPVSSGVYLYRLRTNHAVQTKKMLLVR